MKGGETAGEAVEVVATNSYLSLGIFRFQVSKINFPFKD